ncbi:MAG: hypothetical protein J5656_04455 [Clostridia bacterium]|nr:hypothetical protein [Clostridia bacterium]
MSSLFTKDIAVLDIGSRLISAIVGVKKAQSVFGIKSDVEKQYAGYSDGDWLDKEETRAVCCEVLREAIEGAQSNTTKIYVGVPAEFCAVVTKNIGITLDRERKIIDADIDFLFKKGDVFANDPKYQTINHAAIYYSLNDEDKLYFDVRGLTAQKADAFVSYCLAERKFIKFFDEITKSCGFDEVHYICTPWAECLALFEKEERDNSFIMVDIGYISSHVAIGRGEGILSLASFSMGGAHIAADMLEYLDVPYEVAERAKDLVDLNLNYAEGAVLIEDGEFSITATEACDIVKARLDMFADIIKQVLSQAKYDTPAYAPIYLTGEGISHIRGAKKYLSEQLVRNIEIVSPKLPGYVKASQASKTSLLMVAESLAKFSFKDFIKRLFNGGKK